ncbi:dTDP-4-dehydrorhamnose reductase [Spirilliplanes yamanashiensis]|uniref:dTDP-4-dehydrorhamnose reductase n=1 Tax=Spirilliplanes yamanashiensis TaxID=42233 RepID=A0A8J3YC82_9ACTN|nr:dTDP-4-dehydrorhamnose reductase [Spirilliplanes yamanashiensis]GIJ05095.1 dTDP-4-dehydrorhamnose reductase [Spirilliplanes yamanashiensis]
MVGTRSADLDITDRAAVLALVSAVRPRVVVNCAYRNDSWAVCADGAAHVALAAAAVGARLVHVSTDALHGGRPTPYGDAEPPTPVHMYGAAKAAAETAVTAIDPSAVLVRTSLIVDGDGRSKQIALCRDMIEGRIPGGALFADEYRCPVDVGDLAAAVLELAASDVAGTLNVAGPEPVSRVRLGELVAARWGLDPARIPVDTVAARGLHRPADVRLDASRAAGLLATPLRPVSEILARPLT